MPFFSQPKVESPEVFMHKQSMARSRESDFINSQGYDDQMFLEDKDEREQLLRWQQNINPELEELKHDLLNEYKDAEGNWKSYLTEVFDEETGKLKTVDMPPRMNSFGVQFVLSNIKRYINRNTMRCSMSTEEINTKMRSFSNAMTIALAVNSTEYQINMTEYHSICRTIRSMVHFTLLRALNDGERKNEREIRRLVETNTGGQLNPTKKPGGVFA